MLAAYVDSLQPLHMGLPHLMCMCMCICQIRANQVNCIPAMGFDDIHPCLQNFTVDECGPVHITMGDGGNIEGVCKSSNCSKTLSLAAFIWLIVSTCPANICLLYLAAQGCTAAASP